RSRQPIRQFRGRQGRALSVYGFAVPGGLRRYEHRHDHVDIELAGSNTLEPKALCAEWRLRRQTSNVWSPADLDRAALKLRGGAKPAHLQRLLIVLLVFDPQLTRFTGMVD